VLSNLLKPRKAARDRPARREVEPVALALIGRYGADIMATARRYSSTREDAEDAYQRGLEILLTKAPSVSEQDLVPWLKTVVKHEAFSLHRARERHGAPTDRADLVQSAVAPPPHEQVERLERLQQGAEALGRLKPQEIRCMLLLAEGHSYKQIQEITGFSYTKVNRCLSEGRRSFLRRVERIESGAECERLAPLLSALADGEAGARELALLRPHLRTCLSCRAALRDAREVPARVAVLAPVGLLAGAGGGHHALSGGAGGLRSAWDWLHERAVGLVLRGHDALEAATAHKVAAAAASAAALGGGGIATIEVTGAPAAHHHRGHHAAPARPDAVAPAARAWRPAAATAPLPARPTPAQPRAGRRRTSAHSAAGKRPVAAVPPPAPAPQPARAPARSAAPTATSSAGSDPSTGEFGP
jgi:RNA polymerase sigma factor (sigma-70 family)